MRCSSLVWEDSKISVNLVQIHSSDFFANKTIPKFNSPDLSVNPFYQSSSHETNFQYWEHTPEFILFLNSGVLFPYSLTQTSTLEQKLHMCDNLGNKRFI